jgi:hypothetical protein
VNIASEGLLIAALHQFSDKFAAELRLVVFLFPFSTGWAWLCRLIGRS